MSLQVRLLRESFEEIKPQADEFVTRFYDNLFTTYPEVQPLFSHSNMAEQKKKLLNSLILIIENLEKPDFLESELKDLGAKHFHYGTLHQNYSMVGDALLKTFEEYLGKKWTPEVKQAWIDAYSKITELMLSGVKI